MRKTCKNGAIVDDGFKVAFAVTLLVAIVASMTMAFAFLWLAEIRNKEEVEKIYRITRPIIFVSSPIAVISAIVVQFV